MAYYSEEADAMDQNGMPNNNFVPNFTFAGETVFPGAGCYFVKLLIYKESFEEAMAIVSRTRNLPPPIYNERRLSERPIPRLSFRNENDLDRSIQQNSFETNFGEVSFASDSYIEDNDSFLGVIPNDAGFDGSLENPLASVDDANESATVETAPNQTTNGLADENAILEDTLVSVDDANESAMVETTPSQTTNSLADANESAMVETTPNQTTNSLADANESAMVETTPSQTTNSLADENASKNIVNESGVFENTESVGPIKDTDVHDPITASVEVATLPENVVDSNGSCPNPTTSNQSESTVQNLSSSSENGSIASTSETANSNVQIKRELVLVAEACRGNNNELEILLDDDVQVVDEYDNEITFTYNRKTGYGKPFKANEKGLIKHEKDVVSGGIPFGSLKEGRVYMLGEKQIIVPAKVIDTFLQWNTEKPDQVEYDERQTIALLLVCVTPGDLAQHKVSNDVIAFLKGFLEVRAAGNVNRLNRLEEYIDKFCSTKAAKKN
ncbi:uncharacterized protein LOC129572908 [Sitodiplosis mosellana]|uniref:uncharacterized protein LOC129572908 n=1 Tax=Sitodiplosis mosellana TaxID=263140 RepID=UPI0024452866|nr:uncharacterized protein LOC129572908 [Sitodiplosis mosellana]